MTNDGDEPFERKSKEAVYLEIGIQIGKWRSGKINDKLFSNLVEGTIAVNSELVPELENLADDLAYDNNHDEIKKLLARYFNSEN